MFQPDTSPSSAASSYTRSSFDEKSEADIEEAKCWIAAQWRLSGVPVLKLKESSYVDTRRWKANEWTRTASADSAWALDDTEKKVPILEEDIDADDVINPVHFTTWGKMYTCTSIILMTAIRYALHLGIMRVC